MNIKTIFFNEDTKKEVYMNQLKLFFSSDGEHLVASSRNSYID